MLGRKLLVSLARRERLGRLDETAAAVGIFIEIHSAALGLFRPPLRRERNIVMGKFDFNPAPPTRKRPANPRAGGPCKASASRKYGDWERWRKGAANGANAKSSSRERRWCRRGC